MAPLTYIFLGLSLLVAVNGGKERVIGAEVVTITTDNWRDMLTGEWMVEFYAPWCPYCTQFSPVWEDFADWVNDFDVKVAKVDITNEPILGGQFMIEQLPTIFHIKDGDVRLYSDERNPTSLQDFIEKNNYLNVDPIPWYKSPTSLHMYGLGVMFQLAQEAQKLEEYLRKEYNLSTWGIFGIMATGTVVIGLLIGLVCVLVGEVVSRARSAPKRRPRPQKEEKKPTESKEPVPIETLQEKEAVQEKETEEEKEIVETVQEKGNEKKAKSDKPRKRNKAKRETD